VKPSIILLGFRYDKDKSTLALRVRAFYGQSNEGYINNSVSQKSRAAPLNDISQRK